MYELMKTFHINTRHSQFRLVGHLTVIDRSRRAAGVTLSNIKAKASFENDEHHNIQEADVEIAFTSHAAAEAFLSSIKALQHQLFLSYLQSPRLGETVQLRR